MCSGNDAGETLLCFRTDSLVHPLPLAHVALHIGGPESPEVATITIPEWEGERLRSRPQTRIGYCTSPSHPSLSSALALESTGSDKHRAESVAVEHNNWTPSVAAIATRRIEGQHWVRMRAT